MQEAPEAHNKVPLRGHIVLKDHRKGLAILVGPRLSTEMRCSTPHSSKDAPVHILPCLGRFLRCRRHVEASGDKALVHNGTHRFRLAQVDTWDASRVQLQLCQALLHGAPPGLENIHVQHIHGNVLLEPLGGSLPLLWTPLAPVSQGVALAEFWPQEGLEGRNLLRHSHVHHGSDGLRFPPGIAPVHHAVAAELLHAHPAPLSPVCSNIGVREVLLRQLVNGCLATSLRLFIKEPDPGWTHRGLWRTHGHQWIAEEPRCRATACGSCLVFSAAAQRNH
mmetsp:Transcript_52238/g.144636  ORF Transcript_52238/g.144636 Transcript_52238/m.144636 type:complete len:278 (+) Transcript_52238:393-1226(+)